jgi:hypothetical protein
LFLLKELNFLLYLRPEVELEEAPKLLDAEKGVGVSGSRQVGEILQELSGMNRDLDRGD